MSLVRVTLSLYPHEFDNLKRLSRVLARKLGLPEVAAVSTYRQAIKLLAEREGVELQQAPKPSQISKEA